MIDIIPASEFVAGDLLLVKPRYRKLFDHYHDHVRKAAKQEPLQEKDFLNRYTLTVDTLIPIDEDEGGFCDWLYAFDCMPNMSFVAEIFDRVGSHNRPV